MRRYLVFSLWTIVSFSTVAFSTTAVATPAEAGVKNSENTLKLADGAKSPAAKIADLGWLTGYWQGEGFGGHCEEGWSAPIGDRMFGWFAMRKDDELVFSEAMTVVEVEDSLVMRIKHFDPEFVGWEEKADYVSFPLVRLEPGVAYFSGLTFKRVEDRLEIYVVLENDGKRSEHGFEMTRSEW